MDKLEPILKQKFWIILVTGMILTVTGWWMATGSLAATIAARKTEIENAEKGIPSGEMPNDDWSQKLAKINEQQEAMVANVRRTMWEQQAETMVWPEPMREFTEKLPYRGEFGLVARDIYRSSYTFAVEDVWRKARPIDLDGSGVVLFPRQAMPLKKSIIGDLAPRSEDIWDAQEDLWLLTPLLQAVTEVNGGENGTRLDASIYVIERLELMGGERTTGESTSSSGSGGGGAMDFAGGMGMGLGGGAQGGGNAAKVLTADFNPEEEFGTTGREGRSGGGGMGGMMSMMSAEGSGGATTDTAVTVKRYVDDDESAPFKTRAFYMLVVMDHRKVPRFLAELTAGGTSPWPVEIIRTQMSRVNPDDAEGRNPNIAGMGPMAAVGGAMEAPAPIMTSAEAGTPGFGEDPGLGVASAGMPRVSIETALQDPTTARVAIAGLIYMYRPVDPAPTPEPTEDPSTQQPPSEVAELPEGEAMPAEPAPPADPNAAAPADPGAATAPASPVNSAADNPAADTTPPSATTPPPAAPTPEAAKPADAPSSP